MTGKYRVELHPVWQYLVSATPASEITWADFITGLLEKRSVYYVDLLYGPEEELDKDKPYVMIVNNYLRDGIFAKAVLYEGEDISVDVLSVVCGIKFQEMFKPEELSLLLKWLGTFMPMIEVVKIHPISRAEEVQKLLGYGQDG